jgi:hypothetical protein
MLDSMFSIMGALCKADNVVTRDEINAVKQETYGTGTYQSIPATNAASCDEVIHVPLIP